MNLTKTNTSIFMLPTVKLPKGSLRKNGFINAYLKDELSDNHYEDCIYILFKPERLDRFKDFLDSEYERTKQIVEDLKWDFNVFYDEKDAVGKRYRRQDANGTPFCITVDHDTLNDNMVTIRHRDSMEQQRVAISELRELIKKEVDVRSWLMKM